MHFKDATADEELQMGLINAKVASNGDLAELIDRCPEESGSLYDDVILPNARDPKIDSARWVFWMVREHGLLRLNRPSVGTEFIAAEKFDAKTCQAFRRAHVYPIARQLSSRGYVVAVGRMEYFDRVAGLLGDKPILLAATPAEISAILEKYSPFCIAP
jgi:hypothetical protein